MSNLERRLDNAFETLFDNQPTARVFAVNMIIVAASELIDANSFVSEVLFDQWALPIAIIHGYMLLIISASIATLAQKNPAWWWHLPGMFYVVLSIASVIVIAVADPNLMTISNALRIFAYRSLLFYLLIKNLRGKI